jgi:hypothetical protein
MCLIPPMCLFCAHYHQTGPNQDLSCDAFDEIPDAIFLGEFDHNRPYPGDRGIRFELDPEQADDYAEAMAIRAELRRSAADDAQARRVE